MTTYIFHSRIGSGGFGLVHEVEREPDGATLAGKILRRGTGLSDRKRFYREVRLQAKLDHQHIVPILGMNMDDDPPWFVMPMAQENLREHLERVGPGEERLWIFEEVADALAFAHENGVLHRDVKPENILLFETESGSLSAALADFGLGKLRERDTSPLTSSDAKLGTVQYAAPEQWSDARDVDERADVYALGKVLYELLMGEIPYPDSAMRIKDVASTYGYIVEKAIEPAPNHRYSTVRLLLADVQYARGAAADLRTPTETANELIQDIVADSASSAASLARLVELLLANLDDTELLTKTLPAAPRPVIRRLLADHRASFKRVLDAYDEEVSGSLPFSYCDVVANFYEAVFTATSDRAVHSMILRRLPRLGYEHNRWHVGGVFAGLVGRVKDPALVMVIRDVFNEDPEAADWCRQYLQGLSLPAVIRKAVGLGSQTTA
jgi:serine/threonine protein kinase